MPKRILRGRGDRGDIAVSHLAVILVVVSLAAALIGTGVGEQISSSTSDAVCRVVQGDGCGEVRAGGAASSKAAEQGEGSGSGGSGITGFHSVAERGDGGGAGRGDGGDRAGGDRGSGGCGLLGLKCAGRAVGSFGSGVWGGAEDSVRGLKALVTTNPVTTAKGLVKFVWEKSLIPQARKAVHACSSGDWRGCADSVGCAAAAQYCLIGGMVFDSIAQRLVGDGHYSEAVGRVGWNAESMVIPVKIPGLGKLGKAKEPGDAVGAPLRKPLDEALSELDHARQSGKGQAVSADDALKLAEDYRRLTAAEQVKFLERFTPKELLSLYVRTRKREQNLAAEILANAPAATIKKIDPNDLFIRGFRFSEWKPFEGELWGESGPSYRDIKQGDCMGDCWLLGSGGAMPDNVRTMLHENRNGTITSTFGDGTKVTVTRDLPVAFDGRPIAAVVPAAGPGWPAIYEKVFAERLGGYAQLDEGRSASYPFELMGKDVRDMSVFPPVIERISKDLKNGHAYMVDFSKDFVRANRSKNIKDHHSYFIVGVDPAKGTLQLGSTYGKAPITFLWSDLSDVGVRVHVAFKD